MTDAEIKGNDAKVSVRITRQIVRAAAKLVEAWKAGEDDARDRARLTAAVSELSQGDSGVFQGRNGSRRFGGGNYILPNTAARLVECLKMGLSVRQIVREIGVGKNTVRRYEQLNGPFTCPCGQPRVHRGWCKERIKHSPLRQQFLRTWFERSVAAGTRQRAHKPINIIASRTVVLSNWPYLRGKPGDGNALVDAVNEIVPRTFPDHMRADICQDLLLSILEGTSTIDDLKSGKADAIKRYWKLHPGKFGPISLDAPIPGTDGLTLLDTLSTDSPHF